MARPMEIAGIVEISRIEVSGTRNRLVRVQEAFTHRWGGDRARVLLPEPRDAAPGDEAIHRIANPPRQNHRDSGDRPGKPKSSRDRKNGVRLDPDPPTFDQHHAVRQRRRDRPRVVQNARRSRRLKRRESKLSAAIPPDDPSHGAIAEIADTVEQDDGMV